jgi:type IX secretion system PorP/SprF family membrane protein
MKKIILITSIFLIAHNSVISQDVQLTQFFSSPAVVNPAFAGANTCSRFVVIHRDQWCGVSKAYRTSLVTYDHYFANKNLGISAMVISDKAGSGSLQNNYGGCAFSYEAVINRESSLRLAVQPGYGSKSINFQKLYFGDQIVRGGNVNTVENPTTPYRYFDISAGILYSFRNFWTGVSASHIDRFNESFYTGSFENIPFKYSVQMGSRFLLNKNEKDERKYRSIYPVIIYKAQQKFDQVDLGLYYSAGYYNLGVWYRGIPLLKSYKPGYQNNDALAFIAGINGAQYKIAYSYDLTISKLTAKTMGTHEISLSYQFCKAAKKKQKRNSRIVYCPKF